MAHNGSIVPVPGRDIFAQAWYQGGLSVIDFTDSSHPVEIAYFDRGPIDAENLVVGGYWSTYYYRGRIYGTEIVRGLDVLKLTPGEHLSENEIAAAALADSGIAFNPQQQFPVSWPDVPVVARAYIDQLERGGGLTAAERAELDAALERTDALIESGARDKALARELDELAGRASRANADAPDMARRAALARTLRGIAADVR